MTDKPESKDANKKADGETKLPSDLDRAATNAVYKVNLPDGLNERISELARISLPNNLNEQISRMISAISSVYTPNIEQITHSFSRIIDSTINSQFMDATRGAQEAIAALVGRIDLLNIDFSGLSKVAETLAKSTQWHFPDNWSENTKRECADLCVQGLPVIFIPRASTVDGIVQQKSMASIKRFITQNNTSSTIIEDCEKAIADSTWLSKDMRSHILASIDCYKSKNYRGAQSVACVAFDSLLNHIVNMQGLRKAHNNQGELAHRVINKITREQRFKDVMKLPLGQPPFYTVLMFPVINHMLTDFKMGDKASYGNDINRHMSAHTVSSKQYKKSNALIAIMTVASMCKVTQIQGKNWMQHSAESYGVIV